MNPNPDFTIWLDMVWQALSEEDLINRERMLQDANVLLEQLRPQAQPASEHPLEVTDAVILEALKPPSFLA
jgi:hypothetical protein